MHHAFSRRRPSSSTLRAGDRPHDSRPWSSLGLAPWQQPWRGGAVREDLARFAGYAAEGSECRARGSIDVAADARWMATLTVPIPEDGVMFLHLERSGALPLDYRGGEERADFSVPVVEVDALVALLAGIVSQARRDGVLPAG